MMPEIIEKCSPGDAEAGSLSSAEYEARVRARRDFQRLLRRDSDGDRQV